MYSWVNGDVISHRAYRRYWAQRFILPDRQSFRQRLVQKLTLLPAPYCSCLTHRQRRGGGVSFRQLWNVTKYFYSSTIFKFRVLVSYCSFCLFYYTSERSTFYCSTFSDSFSYWLLNKLIFLHETNKNINIYFFVEYCIFNNIYIYTYIIAEQWQGKNILSAFTWLLLHTFTLTISLTFTFNGILVECGI